MPLIPLNILCHMLKKFIHYIDSQNLAGSNDKILLTVSGGIDSASMAHLFQQAGYAFDIAHCNFKLRGKESDGDQTFVQQLAEKYGCKIYCKDFDTKEFAQQSKISIQMAARKIRYQWFEKLATTHNYSCIAVAHNRDDYVETILINLIRGTGLKGLTGIKPRQGKIIRPLLFATRKEITEYVKKEKLTFREDSSNADTKYHRNLIRKEILPLIGKINPSFTETLIGESEIFQSAYSIYHKEIEKIRKAISLPSEDKIVYSIPKIQSLRLIAPIIFDLISPYGFNYTDSKNLLEILNAEPGRKFFSDSHVLLKDRKTLIIEEINKTEVNKIYNIEEHAKSLSVPVKLTLEKINAVSSYQIPKTSNIASIDYDKLVFPLRLRHWEKGDYFFPLGLKGKKKLSDFFVDRKINLLDKEKIWLLVSENDIVWVVGYQPDDRYKVTSETKNILQIVLID